MVGRGRRGIGQGGAREVRGRVVGGRSGEAAGRRLVADGVPSTSGSSAGAWASSEET
ncbi:hypothetical protein NBM05_12545 [Rothia sp. AR01]|uniref:Uncharacterized protein n=1 Tax=Rothia santali TaxID=2949643 RepID=A0A9X2HBX7_9MICC|nr:hypothetical protein [Rothia santali]MCP3426809.1 hypothetical protein [Rothia santali]